MFTAIMLLLGNAKQQKEITVIGRDARVWGVGGVMEGSGVRRTAIS